MISWYVLDDTTGSAVGPFSRDQIKTMVANGCVRVHTRVARVGSREWAVAESEPHFLGLFPVTGAVQQRTRSESVGVRRALPAICREALRRIRAGWNIQVLAALVALSGAGLAYGFGRGVEHLLDLVPSRPSDSKALLRVVLWFDLLLIAMPILLGAPLAAAMPVQSANTSAKLLLRGFTRFGPAILTAALILILGLVVAIALPWSAGRLIKALASGPDSAGILGGLFGGMALFASSAALLVTPLWLVCNQAVVLDERRAIPALFPILRASWLQTWRYRGVWLASGLLGLTVIALSFLFLGVGVFLIGIPAAASLAAETYAFTVAREGATAHIRSGATMP